MIRKLPFFVPFIFCLVATHAVGQGRVIVGQKLGQVDPKMASSKQPTENVFHDPRQQSRKPRTVVNHQANPTNGDPIRQWSKGTIPMKSPCVSFDGMSGGFPPDPTGAAGHNHYVQAVNSRFHVYDKEGNSQTMDMNLSNLWPGSADAGDPIVLYDRFVDRWVITQLQNNNDLLLAVSTTSDPLSHYNAYSFTMPSFPDYPKYSIWSDGYYITANGTPDNVAVIDRQAMIAGATTVNMQVMDLPVVAPHNDFHTFLPADADGDLPPLGTPQYLFYMEDDAWGAPQDQIVVLKVKVDWVNAQNSQVDTLQVIPTAPFDANFHPTWDDIEQKGSSQRIDAIASVLSFRGQYLRWNNYNTVLLSFVVDVNQQDLGGVRWMELRQHAPADTFVIHQEGTYAPSDGDSRFISSLAMDYDGNIGMGFSISGVNSYPSLGVTGRLASDPLGEMTMQEVRIAEGASAQSNTNRFGDYSHMSLDPDGVHFWFTGEYLGENEARKTRIYSFALSDRAGQLDVLVGQSMSFRNTLGGGVLVCPELEIPATIVIYSMEGKRLRELAVQPESSEIVLNTLSPGAYIAVLYAGSSQRTLKFTCH